MEKIVKKISFLLICGLAAITLSSCGNNSKVIKYNTQQDGWYYAKVVETCTDETWNWIGYTWKEGEGFVPERKVNRYFSSNGKKQKIEQYDWDYNKKKWIGDYKGESTYDSKTGTTTLIEYDWDYEKDKWVKAS